MNKKASTKGAPHSVTQQRPVAPPVYKPQPVQKVAQAKRPVAPPVYKPQPQQKAVQAKKATSVQAGVAMLQNAKRPVAPTAFRPPSTPRAVQPKMTTADRRLPAAPPVYRPQQTPKVLQAKTAPGQSIQRKTAAPPVARPFRNQTIQRMKQVPGLPGFYDGELPEENRGGTFNTVWSQTEPMEDDMGVVSHSSKKFTKRAREHLVNFALMGHLEDEENTHAEDRLFAYAQQMAIQMAIETGRLPKAIEIPEFFVSASPCSSTFGTSAKSTGCTENLISWATTGIAVESEMGCVSHVRVTIGKLTVNKLYKCHSYDGATGSMAALILLRRKGAIGSWEIEQDPGSLDTGRIPGYSRLG